MKQILYTILNKLESITDIIVEHLTVGFAAIMFAGFHYIQNMQARKGGSSITFYTALMAIVTVGVYIQPKIQEKYTDFKNRAFTTQRVIEEL